MWKTISAIFAASLIAGAVSLLDGSDVNASAPAVSAKTDRADMEQTCTQHGWPHYQTACLRDDSRNAGRVLKVRVVSADRLPHADPKSDPALAPYWPAMLAELQFENPAWARGRK